jgi:hypothetical protein
MNENEMGWGSVIRRVKKRWSKGNVKKRQKIGAGSTLPAGGSHFQK